MSSHVPEPSRALVRRRAALRCEYCGIHEDDCFFSHEPDHVIAEKHGGITEAHNLALSCFECNRFKGTDIGSIDPETGILTPLFNPRRQIWEDHFRLEGGRIVPLSAEARVTERLLHLNAPSRIVERLMLQRVGRYPGGGA